MNTASLFSHPNRSKSTLQRSKFLLIGVVSVLLASCASYPSSIAVNDPDQLPTLKQLLQSPQEHAGDTVVLGGQIIKVSNTEQHTVLEILQKPLWDSGHPRSDQDASNGRFRAELDYFVDPEIYKKGREVTVRGTFTGLQQGKIGSHEYQFAHINVSGIELWREQPETEVHYIFGYDRWGPSPFYRPRLRPTSSVNLVVPLKRPAN